MPKEIYDIVKEEAEERGCTIADVWREVIVEFGYPAWAAAGEA